MVNEGVYYIYNITIIPKYSIYILRPNKTPSLRHKFATRPQLYTLQKLIFDINSDLKKSSWIAGLESKMFLSLNHFPISSLPTTGDFMALNLPNPGDLQLAIPQATYPQIQKGNGANLGESG